MLPWLNGQPLTAAVACLPVASDGLFETCRLRQGRIPLWSWHEQRLRESLSRLGFPATLLETVKADLQAWQRAAGTVDGVLRISLYRTAEADVQRRLEYRPLPASLPDGLNLHLCQLRLPDQTDRAGIKQLDRQSLEAAASEWAGNPAVDDGVLCNARGELIESTRANLFLRRGDVWLTPDLSQQGVAGVMRRLLLEQLLPQRGIDVRVQAVPLAVLAEVEEVFLCNAVRGIMPVVSLADGHWPVGSVTRQLQQTVEAMWA